MTTGGSHEPGSVRGDCKTASDRECACTQVPCNHSQARWRATALTVFRLVLTEEQAAAFDPLFAHLSSEWSKPVLLRAERQDDGTYLVELRDADEVCDD